MNQELGLLDTIIKTLGASGIIIICLGGPSLVMAFMDSDHRRYERERLEAAKAEGGCQRPGDDHPPQHPGDDQAWGEYRIGVKKRSEII